MSDEECCICFEPLTEFTCPQILKCKHVFHTRCITNVTSLKCPLCRADIELSLTKRQRKIITRNHRKAEEERNQQLFDELMQLENRDSQRFNRVIFLLALLVVLSQNRNEEEYLLTMNKPRDEVT